MATIEKEKALDVVRQMVADGQVSQEVAEKYFPELKESEDERIRQLLLRFVEYDMPDNYSDDFRKEDCLVWLKKQGEQKSADKVEPKFKVGDRIRYKHDGYNRYKIEGIGADYYVNGFGQRMDMSYTDANFEIINKPAWSEEDETVLNNLIYALANDRIGNDRNEYVSWLKSLKQRIGG